MERIVKIFSSLKARIIFIAIIVLLIVFSVSSFRNYVVYKRNIEENIFYNQQISLTSQSEVFRTSLSSTINLCLNLGTVMGTYDDIPQIYRRQFFTSNLKSIIEQNNQIYGIWAVFKPFSIDSLDNEYLSFTENLTGQFVSTFFRQQERIVSKPADIADYTKLDLYLGGFQDNPIFLIAPVDDPYWVLSGKSYVIRIIAPIVNNRKIVGIVGIDLDYNSLLENFGNTQYDFYILNDNLNIIYTKDFSKVNRKISDVFPYILSNEDFLKNIAIHNNISAKGNFYNPNDFVFYSTYSMYFIEPAINWTVLFTTSAKSIVKQSNQEASDIFISPAIAMGIILLLIIVFVFFISNTLQKIEKRIITTLKSNFVDEKISNFIEFEKINIQIKDLRKYIDDCQLFTSLIIKNDDSGQIVLPNEFILSKNLVDIKNKIVDEQKLRIAQDLKQNNESKISGAIAAINNLQRLHVSNLEVLSYETIKYIADFTGAVQAGFYLNDRNSKEIKYLDLIAFYSYNRKVFNNKRIEFGDGLAGTCAQEMRPIYTNVPPNYLEITSGLGSIPPKYIFLLPMIQNNELMGILEFAFLDNLDEYYKNLLEQSAIIIASTIFTSQTTSQTLRLLEETQNIRKELEDKELQMNEQIEKLENFKKKSEAIELDLTAILSAIEKIVYYAEFDIYTNILSINSQLSLRLQLQVSDAMLLTYYDVFFISETEKHKNYWKRVLEGKTIEFELPIIMGKFNFWFKSILSPVYNVEGKIYKVVFFAIDITEIKQKEDELKKIIFEYDEKAEQIAVQEQEMSDFVIEFQNQTDELNSLNQQMKQILEEKEKTEQSLEFWQKEFQKRTNHFKRMEMNLKTRIRTLEDEVKKLGGQI